LASPGCAFIQSTSALRSSAGNVFARDQKLRVDRRQPDRREVLLQIVIEVIDDAADMGVPLADVDGVAIGRGARHAADAKAAAGAADILDHDRLTEQKPHLVRQNARGDVSRAARRIRHDQRDRPRGKSVGMRGRKGGAKRQCNHNDQFSHSSPPRECRTLPSKSPSAHPHESGNERHKESRSRGAFGARVWHAAMSNSP
jgi:hypothetical protein